jgi:hypothetical protein
MSTNDLVIVSDRRTDLQQSPGGDDALVKVVFSSPALITPTVALATSSNNQLMNFTIYSPGLKNIIERCLRIKMNVLVSCPVTAAFPNAYFEQFFDCPKQFPINNSIQQLSLSINGTSISFQPYELMLPLLTYNNTPEFRSKEWSESCAMPDTYQQYSDGLQLYGTARDPMSPFGAVSNENSRGGFSYVATTSVEGLAGRERLYTFTEPLMISPLALKVGEIGLCNINSIQVQLTMVPNLFSRMWAHVSGGAGDYDITAASASIIGQASPELLYDVLTPSALNAARIPASLNYEYVNYRQYFKSYTSLVVPPAITPTRLSPAYQVQSDAIRLNSIPRAIYLFLRRPKDSQTCLQSDSYCFISNVSILFNNSAILLNTAKPQDLYQMAVRNGFNKSWTEWSSISGSVLRLEFGRDIAVPENSAPNSNAYSTIQVTAMVQSLSTVAEPWDFYQVIATEGTATISADKFQASVGELTTQDVIRAEAQDVKLTEDEFHRISSKDDVFGGRLPHMKKMKHLKSSVAAKIAGRGIIGGALAPATAAAGKALETSLVAETGEGIGGGIVGGKARKTPSYLSRQR